MRIKMSQHCLINVFLMAHQDDEFGVFWEIHNLISKHEKVIVVYLTSGSLTGKLNERRNGESIKVLKTLGVSENNVYFLGSDLQIPDGALIEHAQQAYRALKLLIDKIGNPQRFYVLAWEGGHQDHDAAHILGALMAKQYGVVDQSYQFPLYTGEKLPFSFFKLFSPLKENGSVIRHIIPWRLRVQFIKYCFYYQSQKKAWLGLFPFFLFHYLFSGSQYLQKITLDRIFQSPHSGRLLYERRGFYEQKRFDQQAAQLMEKIK